MNNTNEPVGSKSGLSTIQRARFGPGMLLQHEDLEQLNTYTRELSRLLFQSFFGCGVVCGLQVSGAVDCGQLTVTVKKGLALACSGDPVYVPEDKTAQADKDKFDPTKDFKVWVALCATTKCCAPRTTTCCTDDDAATSDCTREKDGFEIRIYKAPPDCGCGCPPPKDTNLQGAALYQEKENFCECVDPNDPCYKDHYAGTCGCTCGECSGCDCKCILLAALQGDPTGKWKADHKVRRFIRPVLMRDPQPALDKAALASDPAADPAVAPAFEQLSDQLTEKQMVRIRETWTSFSADERGQVRKILAKYPNQEKAQQLQEILNKYHDPKLAPNVSLQDRNVTSKLAADLAQVGKRKPSASKSRTTK